MTITRYEPLGWLNQLHREMIWGSSEGSMATAAWAPSVDIKEESDKYVLYADLPGVKPEDTDVSMEDGVLTIKGEKKTEETAEKEGYKRVERTFGSFHRRFSLPDTANSDAISAKSKDGVLEIIIPKREAVLPKRIAVTHP
ncbi:MAG: Hsp20/alpha crystallin family protein [Betaproteobacteria bacterium]|nr:MAG: Hsp20/alpha crystallin family protein [Betaproteobacteria bacterium]TDI83073.1 MAG: Hsp20/alpha crystallin family protein [Betaproteobacteria bacterium]